MKIKRTCMVWVVSILAGPLATAQNLSDAYITQLASPLVASKTLDGVSIGYLEGDQQKIVHLGEANDRGRSATNRTLYELGSISKLMTGLLLADAVVRDGIDLNSDANIANRAGIRLPSYDNHSISWLNLSTHRSGLPRLPANFGSASPDNPYREYDSQKAAQALRELSIDRKPGTEWKYSNFAVGILGYLIAENANSTYQELLQTRIAKPLGMFDCTVDLTSDQKTRSATPHRSFGNATPAWDFADMPGAGGVRASMQDMMRFAKAHLEPPAGDIGEAIELAWQQHADADDSGSAMGLGWIIHADGETRGHNGGTGGSQTAMLINRRINTAVIVLCNTSGDYEADKLANAIIQKAIEIDSVK